MLRLARTGYKCTLRGLSYRSLHAQRALEPDSRWPGWQVTIGIEVHAQLKSRQKLFSSASTSDLGQLSNTHVSAYDASFPGTLPRINAKCVDLALRTALALDSQIQIRSAFDRKHYFYSDLPAGYQITQHYAPLALGGALKLTNNDVTVRIKQIQLEQDTAKSTFDLNERVSHIDLNRAGSALMEIVSEPDIHSPEEAADYVRTLQAVLRCVGSSDGNMEQGSLRCDVNVSVNKHGQPPGTRCEIKNLNSTKFIKIAIISEVYRHIELLSNNQSVPQETRGFNEEKAMTSKLRTKEDAHDYRYFPDPDLPPIMLSTEQIYHLRESQPELPEATRARLLSRGLSARDIGVLTSIAAGDQVPFDGEPRTAGAIVYFDKVAQGRNPKTVVNWIIHDLLGQLSARKQTFADNPVSVDQMGELIDLVQSETITGTTGKYILRHLVETRATTSPSELARDGKALHPTSAKAASLDSSSLDLRTVCEQVIQDFPAEAEHLRCSGGNDPVVNKLIGVIMQRTRGRANARAVGPLLQSIVKRDYSPNVELS